VDGGRGINLMSDFSVKPLDESTWPDFARLVEKHNGLWGGCWCMAFHPEGLRRGKSGPPSPTAAFARHEAGRTTARSLG